MSAESDTFHALSSDATLTARVGQRIFPDVATQGAPLPLIVFERTATESISTIHDEAPVASKATISASAWAATRLLAEQIGDEMQIAMRAVGTPTNRFGHFDEPTGAYAAVIDFDVWQL